jgi:hypothetical protein
LCRPAPCWHCGGFIREKNLDFKKEVKIPGIGFTTILVAYYDQRNIDFSKIIVNTYHDNKIQ